MRIQLLSDLHLEFLGENERKGIIQDAGADVIVLAGDIWTGTKGVQWAVEQAEKIEKPIVYVAGNHEFYGHEYFSLLGQMRDIASGTRVRFLECSEVLMDNVLFLGCTLWTDYRADPCTSQERSMYTAKGTISDHRKIRIREDGEEVLFTPRHALSLHEQSRAWLEMKLKSTDAGMKVVITHHAPTMAAQPPQYPIGPLTGVFQSDLEYLMRMRPGMPDAWIFGHTHYCVDTEIHAVRLVSNQGGYPGEWTGDFDLRRSIVVGDNVVAGG